MAEAVNEPEDRRPHLQLACICENVIEDRRGGISLIRIFDRIWYEDAAADTAADPPQISYRFFVALKTFTLPNTPATLTIDILRPDGTPSPNEAPHVDIFHNEDGIATTVLDLNVTFAMPGRYQFSIAAEGAGELIRLPLTIEYRRSGQEPPQGGQNA